MNVLLLNSNVRTRNLHITHGIAQALRRSPRTGEVFLASYADAAEVCRRERVDLVLAIDGQRLQSAIFARLRPYCGAMALWTFDDPYCLKQTLEHEHLFDIIFTNEETAVGQYRGRVEHLPLAGIPAADFGLDLAGTEEQHDVFFCGSAWPNRISLLRALITARPDLKYRVALHYNRATPRNPLPLPASAYAASMGFREFLRACRSSRIVLGLHRKFGGIAGNDTSTTPGPRFFEAGAVGAFQLAEAPGESAGGYLADGRDVVFCDGARDLVAKVDHYLGHPKERRDIAERGQARIAREHLYDHRIEALLARCVALIGAGTAAAPPAKTQKPRLLYVVHNTVRSAQLGGLEIHQDILAQNIKHAFEVNFLYLDRSSTPQSYVLADSSYQPILRLPVDKIDTHSTLSDPSMDRAVSRILAETRFDLVHFFQFINHAPSIADVVRAFGIPYVVSLHDFWTGCRELNLIDAGGKFCDNTFDDVAQCDTCLSHATGAAFGSQAVRRAFYGRLLQNAASLIYMSPSTRQIHEQIYPQLADHPLARIHGAPIPHALWGFRRDTARRKRDGRLQLVVTGNLTDNKGGLYLADALRFCAGLPIAVHIHGNCKPHVQDQLVLIEGLEIHIHGPYTPGEVDLGVYDLSLHLSIWPETYCQTLSEAWAARLVPIVTRIGALADRVVDGVNGYLVEPGEPASLASLLHRLTDERDDVERVRGNITDDLFLDQERHRDLYLEAYDLVLRGQRAPLRPAAARASQEAGAFAAEELGLRVTRRNWRIETAKPVAAEVILPTDVEPPLALFPGDVAAGGKGYLDVIRSRDELLWSAAAAGPEAAITVTIPPEAPIRFEGWFGEPIAPGATQAETPLLVIAPEGDGDPVYLGAARWMQRTDVALAYPELPPASGVGGTVTFDKVSELVGPPLRVGFGVVQAGALRVRWFTPTLKVEEAQR